MASLADFRARFPEFGDNSGNFPDVRVNLALTDALLHMNTAVWGLRADLGQLYMAAHLLAIEGDAFGGTGSATLGSVIQESVGDVSREFAVPGVSITEVERDLAWTKYGIVFSRLKHNIVSTPVVI